MPVINRIRYKAEYAAVPPLWRRWAGMGALQGTLDGAKAQIEEWKKSNAQRRGRPPYDIRVIERMTVIENNDLGELEKQVVTEEVVWRDCVE